MDDVDSIEASRIENRTIGIYKALVKSEDKYGLTISLTKSQSQVFLDEADVASKFEDGRSVIDYFIQNGSALVADIGSPGSPGARFEQGGGMQPRYPKANLADVENSHEMLSVLVLIRLE